MQADDVKALRAHMGMNQEQFADLLGVTRRTVGNWERGEVEPRGQSGQRLRELAVTAEFSGEGEGSLSERVRILEERVDYLEAMVLRSRSDELSARRRSAVPDGMPRVALGHDPAAEFEEHQWEP